MGGHRLIPSEAREVDHRKAGHQSVWSTACQDEVAGGHAGDGFATPDSFVWAGL